MRNILKYLFVTALLLSCSDSFMDLQNEQSVSDTEALTTLEDYHSSITGVYNKLANANYYGRFFVVIPDVMSDDVKQNSQANRVKDYAEYDVNVTDGNAANLWTLLYSTINAINFIINAEVDVPEAVKAEQDHLVGEAYALRGLVYFDLVRLFAQHYGYTSDASHAGVPITLSFDPFRKPARNSVAEVYDRAISDLTTAIGMMRDASRSGNSNTLSKSAVKALLARVYLYKEDWANAESMATDVINDNAYSLVENPKYLDLWGVDNTSESLFEISMTEADNRGQNALGNMYLREGYGDYLPSNDLISLYDPTDVRLQVFTEDPSLIGNYAPYRMKKYPDPTGKDNTKVIRLAEVYLIRAEARARIGTNITGAQQDYNKVSQRAVASAPDITATGEELIDAILKERRLELCFEGQRLWELMRAGQDIVRTDCTSNTCHIEYGDSRVVLPIPQLEMDANPNIEPNPGYN